MRTRKLSSAYNKAPISILSLITQELREEVKELFAEENCLEHLVTPTRTNIYFFSKKIEIDRVKKEAVFYFKSTNRETYFQGGFSLIPRKMFLEVEFNEVYQKIYSYLLSKTDLSPEKIHKITAVLANTMFGVNLSGLKKIVLKKIYEALDPEIYKLSIRVRGSYASLDTYNWVWNNLDFVRKYIDTQPGKVFTALYCSTKYSMKDKGHIYNPDGNVFDNFLLEGNPFTYGSEKGFDSYRLPTCLIDSSVSQEQFLLNVFDKIFNTSITKLNLLDGGTIHIELYGALLIKFNMTDVNYTTLKMFSYFPFSANTLFSEDPETFNKFLRILELGFKQGSNAKLKKAFGNEFKDVIRWFFSYDTVNEHFSFLQLDQMGSWQSVLDTYNTHKNLKELEKLFTQAVLVTGEGDPDSDFDGDCIF